MDPADTTQVGPSDRRPSAWLLLPLALYLYPLVAALLSKSEVPIVLGRYSLAFSGFLLWSVLLTAVCGLAWYRGSRGLLVAALLGLALTTLAFAANSQLVELPLLAAWGILIRLTAAAAILMLAFEMHRRRGPLAAPALAVAVLLLAVSLVDLVLLGLLRLGPQHRQLEVGLRTEYDLGSITGSDVILVGDSFVWGQGVRVEERFGNRLEEHLRRNGHSGRVISLGLIGAGMPQYTRMLGSLPDDVVADRAILAFYLNDMPPPEALWYRLQQLVGALGRTSPTVHLFGDRLVRMLAGDVEAYHQFVLDSYRDDHPTHARRWQLLERDLAAVFGLAERHSRGRPILVILPLMVDFASYPATEPHRRIGQLAAELGFEVLDLLPVFEARLGDGTPHRADPGDNHYNAETHDLMAREILERLETHSSPRGATMDESCCIGPGFHSN